jgi:bifunctional DNA-binding transcriptional regulator/antitoxin component of YhaV-PrlF toxin-antitoxin module
MYTNTSKFRLDRKYGLFTIPKGILNELGWKPGDLVEFLGVSGKVIRIERKYTVRVLKKLKKMGWKYNTKVYKRISKLGGDKGTLGVKSLPEFLIREFNPKHGQIIYFLPARYTILAYHFFDEQLDNLIFAAFNPNCLKRYEKLVRETKEELEKEYRDRIKIKSIEKERGENKEKNNYKGYNFGLFKRSLEFTDKNTDRTRRKAQKFNKALSRDKTLTLEEKIKKFKGYLKKVRSMKHPQKKAMVQDLKDIIKETRLTIKELKKNPEKIFKELPKEEIKGLKPKRIGEKRDRVEEIKRRYEDKNLSSS